MLLGDNMKNRFSKILFILFLSIALTFIILFLTYVILILFSGDKILNYNKNKILKNYFVLEKDFSDSIEELLVEENNIYIEKTKNNIIVQIRLEGKKNSNAVSYINVESKDYNKYKRTIELIKRLNIKYVTKDFNHIEYHFGSPYSYGHGQCIIYSDNIKLYKSKKESEGTQFYKFEKIKKYWYFVEKS